MHAYQQLTGAGTTTRQAAAMTGIARSSADRDRLRPSPSRLSRRVPANALTAAERDQVLRLLDSPQFVDAAPAQIYAALLDQGVYVGSIATMYRILREHRQVKERRRLARHPARARPELVADAPRQVYTWDITKLAGPVKAGSGRPEEFHLRAPTERSVTVSRHSALTTLAVIRGLRAQVQCTK